MSLNNLSMIYMPSYYVAFSLSICFYLLCIFTFKNVLLITTLY